MRVHRLVCLLAVPSPCPLSCRHDARALPADLKALFHRGVRCEARDVAEARSLDAPLGFGSTRSDAAARSRRPARAGRFASRSEPRGRPPTRTWGEGRVFRPCLAPCDSRMALPKERTAIAVAPARPEGRASAASASGLDVDASGSLPERSPTASVSTPEGAGRRRHRDASPKRLVRDPALAPKSGVRWFELVLVILPRLPAYLMPRPLAAHAHARRRVVCAPLAPTPKGAAPCPSDSPGGASRGASRVPTRRWTLGGSWLRHLQQAGGPARARQSSCSPGRPRLDPKTKPLPRSEDRNDQRRSAVGAVGPHIPLVVVIRREHRSARAEMDRDPSRAAPTGVGAASVPCAPKRVRRPRPVRPGRAVIRTCRWSRQRTFPKTRPSR
jgi:hypothetical protein